MGQIKEEKNVGGIEGLCVITPAVHGDERGYFMETYNERDMKEAGLDIQFVCARDKAHAQNTRHCSRYKYFFHNCLLFAMVTYPAFLSVIPIFYK